MASSAARAPQLDIRKPLRTRTNIRRIEESFTTEDTKTTKKNLIRKSGTEGSLDPDSHTDLLRQTQRRDIDLVNVAQSVARTVQLFQELFIAQPFFERLVGKAAVAGKEKRFPVRRNFR